MMIDLQKPSETTTQFLFPSHVAVSNTFSDLHTLLGSCVAVCLYDPVTKCGGMNHYMVPLWNGEGLESPKYGNIAIEMLLQKLSDIGAQRKSLVAKMFGGASQYHSNSILNVGERNILVAQTMLDKLRIPIVASSMGGNRGRKIIFNTQTGEVMMKYMIGNATRLTEG